MLLLRGAVAVVAPLDHIGRRLVLFYASVVISSMTTTSYGAEPNGLVILRRCGTVLLAAVAGGGTRRVFYMPRLQNGHAHKRRRRRRDNHRRMRRVDLAIALPQFPKVSGQVHRAENAFSNVAERSASSTNHRVRGPPPMVPRSPCLNPLNCIGRCDLCDFRSM
jgi:hypothetical protein